jgi:multidrug efflux system outer membrane protein
VAPYARGIACLSVLWIGCALTPDYERPELGLPPTWEEPADAGESIANLGWWEIYEDDVLRALIAESLVANQDLLLSLSRVREAREQVTFVRAEQFPFLDVFGDGGRGRQSKIVAPGAGTSDFFSYAGQVSFEVDLWRKFSRATEGAIADLMATEAAYRTVKLTLVSTVASTYFLLRDFDERLAISENTVKSRRDSLEIIQARFDKGTVPELDVNQAEIELAIAEAAVAGFERSVVQAENALRVLAGRFPGPVARGVPLDEQAVPPEVPPGLGSDLLERRPDVVEAEQVLIAETARIGVAQALRFPSLTLSGSLGAVAEELHDLNANEAKAWNLLASVFQPIFNSGQLKAQTESQRARAEQTLYQYESVLRQAFREVEDALVAVRTYRKEYEIRSRQVVSARNAARLSRARYDAGVVDYLEVLDTERTLFNSELDESATRQAALTAVVQLYQALGGGWTDPAATTQP